MKAAILISGYLRTLKSNLENIRKEALIRFEKCDVYIHITNNEKNEDRYFNPLSKNDIEDIKAFLAPRVIIEEPNLSFLKNKKEDDLLNSWIKYQKLLSSMRETESLEGRYDVVIKYRPDFSFISRIPYELVSTNPHCVFLPADSKVDISKLKNPEDQHVCDVFAFGSSSAMEKYFPTLDEMKEIIRNHGAVPETALYHHLTQKDVECKKLDIEYSILLSSCNVFAIVGDSGSGKSTLADLLQQKFSNSFLLECDRYHKWERGNEMWNKLTHLNPESNFLCKMRSDIFDLKIGKDVFQVDYDHKTGKFTEKERIQSKDNLIVCGLHSMYIEDDRVYDSSIFMDTDDTLRKKWKIRRDMAKRGHSIKRVLEQIKSREEDYQTFIKPQREKSQIIVNFFTNEDFSIEKIDQQDSVGLRIFIPNSRENKDFLKKIGTYSKHHFRTYETSSRHVIEFPIRSAEEYTKKTMGDFYDYVVYTILNTRAADQR